MGLPLKVRLDPFFLIEIREGQLPKELFWVLHMQNKARVPPLYVRLITPFPAYSKQPVRYKHHIEKLWDVNQVLLR